MSRLCLAYPREPQSQSSQALLQSGDTSIRISNSDRIDRPRAKAQAKMRQGNLGQCSKMRERERKSEREKQRILDLSFIP